MDQEKLNVVFCGTPDFCLPVLEMLVSHPFINLTKIISKTSRPVGRGQHIQDPPVVEFAKNHKIPFLQTENINKEEELLSEWEKHPIDALIVLAFSQFLGSRLLLLPRQGCFNIHTSLLPRYRGAAPIQHALLNGDRVTGVSIQRMVKKMDAGDVVAADRLEISATETAPQLSTRLKFQAALSLNHILNQLKENSLHFTPQDEGQVTYAPTLKKEDGFLSFDLLTREEIRNRIRAFNPWPGTYCFLNGKRLKVLRVENVPAPAPDALVVGCRDGLLRLAEVQWEGKTICRDTELLRGIRGPVTLNSDKDKKEKKEKTE